MRHLVTLEVAHKLFEEARAFMSGRKAYLPVDSEIRTIAQAAFHQSQVMHLDQVCYEIFYVLACAAKGVER